MNDWYLELVKPSWAPPAWIFGPVWTVLYVIIAVSFSYTFWLYLKKKIKFKTLLPFLLNLVFNFLFSPLQFIVKNNILALIDIILVLGTLILLILAIYKKKKWIALVNLPYLAWVSFATILQTSITILNI